MKTNKYKLSIKMKNEYIFHKPILIILLVFVSPKARVLTFFYIIIQSNNIFHINQKGINYVTYINHFIYAQRKITS
jgi:hypothetical protein